MVNTTYNSTQDVINKIQLLKGKTKLKLYKDKSNYYDEMKIRRGSGKIQLEEDPFSKKVQGVIKTYHGMKLEMKFLQTKPQVKNMKNIYHGL